MNNNDIQPKDWFDDDKYVIGCDSTLEHQATALMMNGENAQHIEHRPLKKEEIIDHLERLYREYSNVKEAKNRMKSWRRVESSCSYTMDVATAGSIY